MLSIVGSRSMNTCSSTNLMLGYFVKDVAYAYLILGIEDGSWNICGTNLRMETAEWKKQSYELWLRRGLDPSLSFVVEEFDYHDDPRLHIVIFTIPAACGAPIAFYAKELIRIGSNLTYLREYPDYLRKIYNSTTDWSAGIIENASIDDLDSEAIKAAREQFANKHEEFREEMSPSPSPGPTPPPPCRRCP